MPTLALFRLQAVDEPDPGEGKDQPHHKEHNRQHERREVDLEEEDHARRHGDGRKRDVVHRHDPRRAVAHECLVEVFDLPQD